MLCRIFQLFGNSANLPPLSLKEIVVKKYIEECSSKAGFGYQNARVNFVHLFRCYGTSEC